MAYAHHVPRPTTAMNVNCVVEQPASKRAKAENCWSKITLAMHTLHGNVNRCCQAAQHEHVVNIYQLHTNYKLI